MTVQKTVLMVGVMAAMTMAAPARAQVPTEFAGADVRELPQVTVSQRFVEDADPGAKGNFQILLLKARENDRCNPYTGEYVLGETKPQADTFVYNRDSGKVLYVRSAAYVHPYGQGPLGFSGLLEWYEEFTVRKGLTWDDGDIDGDGADDLIGHDPATGEVVRLIQRGFSCNQ